ncbi:unnamed protein product [Caenorhabditis angaria]|uniref:Uncharacterized protein n=1 Tax=Caenorhabditis angaria TaxID=860376 RepID=A0A9P1IT79_9PELO|nr:unnamed protein product [Caenorhabditis angaria]
MRHLEKEGFPPKSTGSSPISPKINRILSICSTKAARANSSRFRFNSNNFGNFAVISLNICIFNNYLIINENKLFMIYN